MADPDRLAFLRTQNEMWRALSPDAETWDTTFLLKIIDELQKSPRSSGSRTTEEERLGTTDPNSGQMPDRKKQRKNP